MKNLIVIFLLTAVSFAWAEEEKSFERDIYEGVRDWNDGLNETIDSSPTLKNLDTTREDRERLLDDWDNSTKSSCSDDNSCGVLR